MCRCSGSRSSFTSSTRTCSARGKGGQRSVDHALRGTFLAHRLALKRPPVHSVVFERLRDSLPRARIPQLVRVLVVRFDSQCQSRKSERRLCHPLILPSSGLLESSLRYASMTYRREWSRHLEEPRSSPVPVRIGIQGSQCATIVLTPQDEVDRLHRGLSGLVIADVTFSFSFNSRSNSRPCDVYASYVHDIRELGPRTLPAPRSSSPPYASACLEAEPMVSKYDHLNGSQRGSRRPTPRTPHLITSPYHRSLTED